MTKNYTKEQVVEMVLGSARESARYWDKVEDRSTLEKIEGALFSFLNVIDGTGNPFVSFDLVLRSNGDDSFEDGMVINEDVYLHELFYKAE